MSDEQQPSLRETIEASIAEHSEPAPDTAVPASPAPTEAEPAGETTEEKAGRLAGRARAPDGKLLPGKAVKPDVATPAAGGTQSPTAQAQVAVAAPELAPIARPSSWKKEMWPLWDKLTTGAPLNAQEARQIAEYNAQRETQFATGVSTYKAQADSAKPILEAIAPFREDLERHGIQAPDMVYRLMNAHRQLALGSPAQKLQMATQVLAGYGIPIQALHDQAAQQEYLASAPAQQAAPVQQQQPQNIEKLIEQTLANREVQQTIGSMAANKEKYPFFAYVRPTMAQLLEAGEATDLDDAYQKALDAPEHAMLTTVQASQQAQQTEQQRVAAAQATARVARANAVSPKSATPASAGAPTGKQGVRDALREAIATHAGGARV